jgi:hypothetical protein
MAKLEGGRPGFREWADQQPDPGWKLMPLTHITSGVSADDIARNDKISTAQCRVFEEPLAYFFYGRPAYRVGPDEVVKVEAACPYCFVFDDALIHEAKAIFAFDTGAYERRLYAHTMTEEMKVEDFSLEKSTERPNKIIARIFSTKQAYIKGDTTGVAPSSQLAEPWEFHARAYLDLITSRGRNEPDDRICSIEVLFGSDVPLHGRLRAVVVPHTLWGGERKAPWLTTLADRKVEVVPYEFIPNRHPEHYHAQLEAAVIELYESWGVL